MLSYLTPHLRLPSVVHLTPKRLESLGLRGLLLDLDGTLKHYRETDFPDEIVQWVKAVKQAGVAMCVFSNGRAVRIGPLAEQLGLPYVADGKKPLPARCRDAVAELGLSADQVAIVGDQVFTDILVGRLAGLFTIYITPSDPTEPWFTRFKRPLERRLLHWLRRRDGST